jgi:hypothetical protein
MWSLEASASQELVERRERRGAPVERLERNALRGHLIPEDPDVQNRAVSDNRLIGHKQGKTSQRESMCCRDALCDDLLLFRPNSL